jgi:hypothetical protein
VVLIFGDWQGGGYDQDMLKVGFLKMVNVTSLQLEANMTLSAADKRLAMSTADQNKL